ncbi:MAG: glycosyltransferase family 2 protein [Pseudomonadales bacterium]|nr:glycosyltransferase family 2 protein [Pseudomonadales bacterium]
MLLSIIIPSKNRRALLEQLLLTINQQVTQSNCLDHVEIIVVDDGSYPALQLPSNTLKTQCQLLTLSRHSGAPKARQHGLESALGEYIHFHDSDDSITDGWLEGIIRHLRETTCFDFLVTARKVITKTGAAYKKQHLLKNMASQPQRIKQRLRYENCLGPLGGVIFSKKATQKMQFTNLPSCQDWDMYLDAIDHKSMIIYDWDIAFIKNDLHEDQISKDTKKKFLGVFRLARKHKIITSKKSFIRLFLVYKLQKSLTNHHALLLFYNTHKLRSWLSYSLINIQKKLV